MDSKTNVPTSADVDSDSELRSKGLNFWVVDPTLFFHVKTFNLVYKLFIKGWLSNEDYLGFAEKLFVYHEVVIRQLEDWILFYDIDIEPFQGSDYDRILLPPISLGVIQIIPNSRDQDILIER